MTKEEQEGLKNLCRFLCEYINEIEKVKWEIIECKNLEEIKDKMIMKFPIIQGMQNQFNIKTIGEQEFDIKSIHNGVLYMLKEEQDE